MRGSSGPLSPWEWPSAGDEPLGSRGVSGLGVCVCKPHTPKTGTTAQTGRWRQVSGSQAWPWGGGATVSGGLGPE